MEKRLTLKQFTAKMTDDEIESEIEWLLEAKSEGYTWKQLAKKYNVSIRTLKKFLSQPI